MELAGFAGPYAAHRMYIQQAASTGDRDTGVLCLPTGNHDQNSRTTISSRELWRPDVEASIRVRRPRLSKPVFSDWRQALPRMQSTPINKGENSFADFVNCR